MARLNSSAANPFEDDYLRGFLGRTAPRSRDYITVNLGEAQSVPAPAPVAPVAPPPDPPRFQLKVMNCCAFHEMHGLSSVNALTGETDPPAKVILGMKDYFLTKDKGLVGNAGNGQIGLKKPFIFFTQAFKVKPEGPGYGEKLATYIRENGLGEVIELPERVNWTNSFVKGFVWVINPKGIKDYYAKLEAK